MERAREIAAKLDDGRADDCVLILELARELLQQGIKNSDLFNGMDEGEEESGEDDQEDDQEDEEEDDGSEDEQGDEQEGGDAGGVSKYYQFDLEEEEEEEGEDGDGDLQGEDEQEPMFVEYVEGNPFECALAVLQRGEQVAQGELLVEVYKLMGEVYGELGEDQDSINCYERAVELLELHSTDTGDYTKQIEILEKLSQNLKLSADISAEEKLEIAKKLQTYLEKQLEKDPKDKELNLARLEEVKLDIKEIKVELEMGADSHDSKELLKNLILNQMAKLNPQFEKKRKSVNDLSGLIKKKKK